MTLVDCRYMDNKSFTLSRSPTFDTREELEAWIAARKRGEAVPVAETVTFNGVDVEAARDAHVAAEKAGQAQADLTASVEAASAASKTAADALAKARQARDESDLTARAFGWGSTEAADAMKRESAAIEAAKVALFTEATTTTPDGLRIYCPEASTADDAIAQAKRAQGADQLARGAIRNQIAHRVKRQILSPNLQGSVESIVDIVMDALKDVIKDANESYAASVNKSASELTAQEQKTAWKIACMEPFELSQNAQGAE